ncbi:class I glutamine amidotransferase-like protein [Cercophora scortea]|uniref:Class I glutamine amidotransferase-like protein n=1 Tax=Cercophora scortea TaxID=314031 RepID=A0AAE0INS7_9PEZI|nr:class I glutamine amidotransferase-like protein [Cercophora scortea]
MAPSTARKSLRIGVIMEEIQLSDIVGIDIFGNLSHAFYTKAIGFDPSYTTYEPQTLDIEWLYIASTLDPTFATPSLHYVPTVTYDTCPRDLDIVIIGGPWPDHRPASADRFFKEAWAKTRVWMTICTGSMWLASSGVLDGHRCTTNRTTLGPAKGAAPKVDWLDQRWVVDAKPYDGEGEGELWTAGGAGAGIDMIAQYCIKNFGDKFVHTFSLDGLEFRPDSIHGQFYKS